MRRSIILSAFFPSSVASEPAHVASMEHVARETPLIDTFEHYFDGGFSERIAAALRGLGKRSILLAALKLKRDRLDIASRDAAQRARAVNEVRRSIDAACGYGSDAVLINTGFFPDAASEAGTAMRSLAASLREILSHAEKSGRAQAPDIFVETGAMNASSRELLGDTGAAIELITDLRASFPGIFLTMDTSHLRQLGEDPLVSIKKAQSLTKHVHLANCVVRDPASPLYGDMHPTFGVEGGELSAGQIASISRTLETMFSPRDILFGVEIICRHPDERAHFSRTAEELGWFFHDTGGGGK